MSSLAEFFNIEPNKQMKGITHKNNIIKRNIIAYMAVNGESTLSELTKELHISVPTITKLVQELIEDNIVNDWARWRPLAVVVPMSLAWLIRRFILQE